MALTAEHEICNLALIKIGHSQDLLDASTFATPGTNPVALVASTLYEPERDAMMEQYPWRFAIKRLTYDVDEFDDTITATTAANPVVVTGTDISVANLDNNDMGVYIWDTGIDDLDSEIFMIKNSSNATESLELYYPDGITSFDGSSLGTASSGYMRLAPLNEYEYAWKLPSDFLRIHKIQYNISYEREGNYLYTDSNEVYFSYIALVTDVSLFSKAFIDCLATKLAAEFAGAITDKPEIKQTQLNILEKITLPRAYRTGAIEATPNDNQERRSPSYNTSWQSAGR